MIFSASPPFSNQNISLFNASLENEKREGGEREGKEGWRTWGGEGRREGVLAETCLVINILQREPKESCNLTRKRSRFIRFWRVVTGGTIPDVQVLQISRYGKLLRRRKKWEWDGVGDY